MTTTELAILSLVAQEPRYGYEVEKVIEERGMRDWAEIGFSSIYYVLSKLEGKGWIAGETSEEGMAGPARKVYRPTQEGLKAWRQGILDVLATPKRYCTPLQVGLASLPAIPCEDAIAALLRYCHQLTERRKYVGENLAKARSKGELPWHAALMFDLSLTMTQAELSWAKRLVKKLSTKSKGACLA